MQTKFKLSCGEVAYFLPCFPLFFLADKNKKEENLNMTKFNTRYFFIWDTLMICNKGMDVFFTYCVLYVEIMIDCLQITEFYFIS